MGAARPAGGRFRVLFVLAAAVMGVGLGAGVFAATSGTFPGIGPIPGFPAAAPADTAAPAPTASATASAAPDASASATPDASASATSDASASPADSASAAPAATTAAAKTPPTVPAVPRPPKPPKNCTPPFTMVDGVKKFKPECM